MGDLLLLVKGINISEEPLNPEDLREYERRFGESSDCCYGADCGDCDCGGYCIDPDA